MVDYPELGPFKIGDNILGDLEVVGLLGVGGHAYVYECVDTYVDAKLAVKVIPNVPGRGKELLKRAHAEAKLLYKLSHPNVVRVTTARQVGEKMVCIVMEKLEGLSLRQFLRLHKRLTVTEALLIVRQIAAGVGAAHKLNVIHRDLKPENVFILPPDNQVKVLDFGIAKFLGQGIDTTNKFRIHGTPLYMSPEHLQSTCVTARSDIYELGTVAFELITGKIPCLVDLENPNYQQLAYAQIMKVPPPLNRMIRDVGPRTEKWMKRATAKDPAQRFSSMNEVIDAIDEALLEQKKLFPKELETVRYLDESMMRASKQAEEGVDDDANDWDPVYTTTPGQPARPVSQIPAEPVVQPKPRAPVMAPTVEVERSKQSRPPPAVAQTPARPPRTPLSLRPDATDNSFAGEARPLVSWFSIPTPIVLGTVAFGMAIAVAISLPEILRARGRNTANVAEIAATTAAVESAPPPPPTADAIPASSPSAMTVASVTIPALTTKPAPTYSKPTPAKQASSYVNVPLTSDNKPTVTKEEIARMRAREKALAADLDRESKAAASAKKAKAAQ
jgi:serine/threonine protein kinase